MLVMEVFPSSADVPDPELNGSQSISSPSEVRLKFCENLVCVEALIGEKFDDDPLFQFHREECSTSLDDLLTFVSGLPRRLNEIAVCKQEHAGLDRLRF
jgi:hypothetical protein